MDIFELLSLQDLYAVAMVSEYFREIAVRVFRLRHRDRYFSHENVSFFVNCLRVFSPSQVQIPYRVDEVIAFEAIAEYCPNLTAISFTKECQEPQSNNIIAKLLPKLRKIEMPDICHCSDNWQVEDLHMAKGIKPLATYVTMPKLVRMKFSYYILHGSDDRAIFEFLSKNRHIEHLSFYTCSLSMAGMRSLAEYLPNLKSLDVDYMNIVGWDTQQKGTVFECLENVTIGRCSHTEWLVDLLDGAPLKRLDLFVEDKQTIKGISRLASLSSLTLRRFTSMTIDDVLQLTRSMKSLEELDLDMGAIGTITLPCIERLLKGLHQLTDLRVGWNKAADFNGAHELDAISTLIANRPDLRVRVDVPHQCTRVSGLFFSEMRILFDTSDRNHLIIVTETLLNFLLFLNRSRIMYGINISSGCEVSVQRILILWTIILKTSSQTFF